MSISFDASLVEKGQLTRTKKKKYINITKCVLFNLELLAFMSLNDAKKYYALIKEIFPGTEGNMNKFYIYFESTWFPVEEDAEPKFKFEILSYYNKFNFKSSKKKVNRRK